MRTLVKRIGLFFAVYALAFLVFSLRTHAQAPQASPAQPTLSTSQLNSRSQTQPAQQAQAQQLPTSIAQPAPPQAPTPVATPPTPITGSPGATAPVIAPKNMILNVQPLPKGFKKIYALLDTSMGKIKILLFHAQVPKTVENFVALVEGTKEFTDPKTKELVKRPFYDGLTFHRVRKNFVIQTGDLAGDGTGSPGFNIPDEFHPDLMHRKEGMVSMANNGPNTGNTQFFITLSPQKDFDKRYPIFGEVVDGMTVVNAIGNVKVNRITEKPVTPVILNKITIIRE